jgi:hypothetical protein
MRHPWYGATLWCIGREEQAMTAESMDVARLREELTRFPAETPVVTVAD